MNKGIFYAFTLFVTLFTLMAWSYAQAELRELENQPKEDIEDHSSEFDEMN